MIVSACMAHAKRVVVGHLRHRMAGGIVHHAGVAQVVLQGVVVVVAAPGYLHISLGGVDDVGRGALVFGIARVVAHGAGGLSFGQFLPGG